MKRTDLLRANCQSISSLSKCNLTMTNKGRFQAI